MNTNPYATARAATTLSALAVLSPLAGVAVEMALAWRFGTLPTVDAFRVAALLLTFGQQLFIFQILPHAVVPVFTEYRAQGRDKEAWHVAFSLTNLLAVPALLASLFAFAWPGPILNLFAPGLTGEGRATASLFIRWSLLTYGPMVWSGVAAGLLYVHRIFWLPPAVQLVGNTILVTMILALGSQLGAGCLVLGMLLSSALGVAIYAAKLLPLMHAARARFPWRLDTAHPGVRQSIRLALPLLGMVLCMQWGTVMLSRALSGLPEGSLARFGYAWKMGMLVVLAPLSLATVMFPQFAEARFQPGEADFRATCTRALRMALFMVIPLTCWLHALRLPVVALLFERGAFSRKASEQVARLFGLLLLGSPAFAVSAYMEKMLYALGKTHIPMLAQLGNAALLAALAQITAAHFGAEGLMVLVGPVATYPFAGLLFLVLYRRHRAFLLKEIAPFAAYVAAMALLSAWTAKHAGVLLGGVALSPRFSLGLAVAGGLAAGAASFVALSLACQLPEAMACSRYLRWSGDAIVRKVQEAVRG